MGGLASGIATGGLSTVAGGVGDVLGGVTGGLYNGLGLNNNFGAIASTNQADVQKSYQQAQDALAQQNAFVQALQSQGGQGMASQTALNGMLTNEANGQGPNPAQQALANATGANVNTQAALMAGQRGAASNVGLMGRQIAQQGAGIQQQAAGQSALMQAQQQLAAQQQLQQLAGTQVGQQAGALQQYAGNTQAEQGGLMNALNSQNNINAGVASDNQKAHGQFVGNIMGAAGSAAGLAHGGKVGYADGGSVVPAGFEDQPTPQSRVAQFMSGMSKGAPNPTVASAPTYQAKGGKVPAMVSPGEIYLPPNKAKAVAKGEADPVKSGERIPGKAKVKGDSLKNDTVSKTLEAGGVVIPRSVMQSEDPAKGAAAFVKAHLARGGKVLPRK